MRTPIYSALYSPVGVRLDYCWIPLGSLNPLAVPWVVASRKLADTSSAQALGYPCGNAAMLRERQQFSILAGSWLSGVFDTAGELRISAILRFSGHL